MSKLNSDNLYRRIFMHMSNVGVSGSTCMPAGGGKIALYTEIVLFAGFITMFVLGILGTHEIISMTPGGAYAMIALGSLAILGLIGTCCSDAKKTGSLEQTL
jgi:hypothetical protein